MNTEAQKKQKPERNFNHLSDAEFIALMGDVTPEAAIGYNYQESKPCPVKMSIKEPSKS